MIQKTYLLHPTYFPSIAQMSLLITQPCVLEVSDNFVKQTLRTRTYIYGANGKQALTLPIKHSKADRRQLLKDVKIENAFPWQRQHWKSLETAYRTSPFFEFYEDDLYPIFEKKHHFLIELNIEILDKILACLQRTIPFERTVKYEAIPKEYTDARFLSIAKGETQVVQTQQYYQIFSDKHGFIPNLSILDLLFHQGPNTQKYLNSSVSIDF